MIRIPPLRLCPLIQVLFVLFCSGFCIHSSSIFLLLFYYSCPNFPPLPSSAQSIYPTPNSHSQSPHHCPCPWVIHTCSLSSPFPFFPSLSPAPSPLAVTCFHASGSILVFFALNMQIHFGRSSPLLSCQLFVPGCDSLIKLLDV